MIDPIAEIERALQEDNFGLFSLVVNGGFQPSNPNTPLISEQVPEPLLPPISCRFSALTVLHFPLFYQKLGTLPNQKYLKASAKPILLIKALYLLQHQIPLLANQVWVKSPPSL